MPASLQKLNSSTFLPFLPCVRPDPALLAQGVLERDFHGAFFPLCSTFFSDFTGFRFSLRTVNSWGQIPPFDPRTATNEVVGPMVRYHDGRHDDSAVLHHRAVIGQGVFILDQNQFVDVIPVTNLRGKTNPNKLKKKRLETQVKIHHISVVFPAETKLR